MPEFKKDPAEIGALWLKKSNNGVEFMSGKINGVDVVCFRSKSNSPKAPAWNVLKSQPKPEGGRPMHNANATPLDDF